MRKENRKKLSPLLAILTTRPTYSKGGAWLKHIRHSNTLCVYATRAITNHAPIGAYCLRFFPKESFACPCRDYPIEITS